MKERVEHRVPLSRRAVEILRDLKRGHESGSDYVFVGQRDGSPLSNMALQMMLRGMKRGDITAHGFRSTFSDWASEVSRVTVATVRAAAAGANPFSAYGREILSR